MNRELMKRIKMDTLFNNLKTWSGTEKSRIKTPKQITLRSCLRKIFQMFEIHCKLIKVIKTKSYFGSIVNGKHSNGWFPWLRELKTANQNFKKLFLVLMKPWVLKLFREKQREDYVNRWQRDR